MKAADIVTQLALRLPQLTDEFTNEISVNSMVRTGTVVAVNCEEPHGLAPGQSVNILGSDVPIAVSTFTRVDAVGTIVTAADHDLTEPIASTVTTSGANESKFNGTFTVIAIANRRTITVTMTDSGDETSTGASRILEGGESALRSYNTVYSVLEAPSTVQFTITHSVSGLADPIGTIIARTKPRISAAVDPTRMIESYTAKQVDDFWLFVVLGDVTASKSRQNQSDAVDNIPRGSEYKQEIIQDFTLYLLIPAATEIAGADARDEAEALFRTICRALLFSGFDSQLFAGTQGMIHFVSHGVFDYNGAFYVHAYSFQQVVDLTFDDTVGDDLDVAFRQIDFTIFPQLEGTGSLVSAIDLDDTPL